MAAQATSYKNEAINHKMNCLTIWWRAAADGSFVDTVIDQKINGRVLCVDTNPGTLAPQDDYDIVLKNADGIDIMGGALSNRDTTNAERALPLLGTTAHEAPVKDCLTLGISGNNIVNAEGEIKIYYLADFGN